MLITFSYTELNWWLVCLYLATSSRRLRTLVHVNSLSILSVSTLMLLRHRRAMARRHGVPERVMWLGHTVIHGLPLFLCGPPRGSGARGARRRASARAVALQAAWWIANDPDAVYVPAPAREWLLSWVLTLASHAAICR